VATRVKKERRRQRRQGAYDIPGAMPLEVEAMVDEAHKAAEKAATCGAEAIRVRGRRVRLGDPSALPDVREYYDRDLMQLFLVFVNELRTTLDTLPAGGGAVVNLKYLDDLGVLEEALEFLLGTDRANLDLSEFRRNMAALECAVLYVDDPMNGQCYCTCLDRRPVTRFPVSLLSDEEHLLFCVMNGQLRRHVAASPRYKGRRLHLRGIPADAEGAV